MAAPGSVRDQVFKVLADTVDTMDLIERPVLEAMLPILQAAQQETVKDLRVWLVRHSGERFTAQRYRNVLVVLQRAIDRAGDLAGTTDWALRKQARVLGPAAIAQVKGDWIKLGQIFEGTIQPLAIQETAVLASGRSLLWPQFESSARRYADSVGDRTRRLLAVGRARNETIDELTSRLTRHLPDVFAGERWDAERLARTETMSAYNTIASEAIEAAHKEDSELVERWDATIDFRRCAMCASLDGQVIRPWRGEKFVAHWFTRDRHGRRIEHTKIIEWPVAHPNCRCARTAWRESWGRYAHQVETGRLAA
jgi:hypothetical protein